jgi:hypothetical protein
MAPTRSLNSTRSVAPVLYVSFELSNNQWKIASTTARGQKARLISIPARDTAQVLTERSAGNRFASVFPGTRPFDGPKKYAKNSGFGVIV